MRLACLVSHSSSAGGDLSDALGRHGCKPTRFPFADLIPILGIATIRRIFGVETFLAVSAGPHSRESILDLILSQLLNQSFRFTRLAGFLLISSAKLC